MTRLFDLAAKCSGCLAGVCAILALLATPSLAWADDTADCYSYCSSLFDPYTDNPDFQDCIGSCTAAGSAGCSQSGCSVTCGAGTFPACGNGACNKIQACVDAGCKCTLIYINDVPKYCECAVPQE
jgi:hypothetical protein